MLKSFLIIVIFMLSESLFSQVTAYSNEFKKSISVLDSAIYTNDFTNAAKSFEKSAVIDKKNWLCFYYAGICNTLIAFNKKGKEIDMYCDKAEKYANIADSLKSNNSEIYVLKSMIAAARINVNAAQRGQKYGAISAKFNVKALSINAENPRAHLQKARAILNTPAAFGGGSKKAKPLFEIAIEKFKTFKPEDLYYPNWGKKEAITELKKIK